MLKRIYRLPAGVRMIHPRTISSPIVLLKKSVNNLSYNRIGFIISKKVAKTAVERNRSKRMLRSCIEDVFYELKPGFDYLFIIRKNLVNISKELICEEVVKMLHIK